MAGGISTTTQRALSSDPDLDQGLYNQKVAPPALSNGLRKSNKFYTPAGKTPQQLAAEKIANDNKYQLYKQGKFK
jgi:hypothetical protein